MSSSEVAKVSWSPVSAGAVAGTRGPCGVSGNSANTMEEYSEVSQTLHRDSQW